MPENKIEIVNMKNTRFINPWDFTVARPSPVGNTFRMHREEDRDRACTLYETYFNNQVARQDPEFMGYLGQLLDAFRTYGKLRLFCFCAPKRCHAETIKRWLITQIEAGI